MTKTMTQSYKQSIEQLHEFFVHWYTGEVDESEIQLLESTLAPDFEKVNPDGTRIGRNPIIALISESYGQYVHGDFNIELRNINLIQSGADLLVVNYEEWQFHRNDESGRITTAVLSPDDNGLVGYEWNFVQDTFMSTS